MMKLSKTASAVRAGIVSQEAGRYRADSMEIAPYGSIATSFSAMPIIHTNLLHAVKSFGSDV